MVLPAYAVASLFSDRSLLVQYKPNKQTKILALTPNSSIESPTYAQVFDRVESLKEIVAKLFQPTVSHCTVAKQFTSLNVSPPSPPHQELRVAQTYALQVKSSGWEEVADVQHNRGHVDVFQAPTWQQKVSLR